MCSEAKEHPSSTASDSLNFPVKRARERKMNFETFSVKTLKAVDVVLLKRFLDLGLAAWAIAELKRRKHYGLYVRMACIDFRTPAIFRGRTRGRATVIETQGMTQFMRHDALELGGWNELAPEKEHLSLDFAFLSA